MASNELDQAASLNAEAPPEVEHISSTGTETVIARIFASGQVSSSPIWASHEDRYWIFAQQESRWRGYVAKRFERLADNAGQVGYPSVETLNRALNVIDSLLPSRTPT